ncbi:hypothetical protein ACROYT_G026004 [Oculina patagonica]
MEFKGIFLTVAVCLLLHVEVVSSRLKCLSSYYQQYSNCGGGNLMKIYTNQCSKVAKKQCEVKSTGTKTTDPDTKFKIVPMKTPGGKRKCIQFTDKQDGTKYALKVVNKIDVVFEEQALGCHSKISSQFLFEEALATSVGRKFVYRAEHTTKCLTSDCSGRFSLMNSKDVKKERKCFFYRY